MLTVLREINEARNAGLNSELCADLESFDAKDLGSWISSRTSLSDGKVRAEITRAGRLGYLIRTAQTPRFRQKGWMLTGLGRLVIEVDDPSILHDDIRETYQYSMDLVVRNREHANLVEAYLYKQNWKGCSGHGSNNVGAISRSVFARWRAESRHARMGRQTALYQLEFLAARSDKGLPCHREFVALIAGLPASSLSAAAIIGWASRIYAN